MSPQDCAKWHIRVLVEYPRPIYNCDHVYTAISIKVVPEQSGKIEYEREMLAENR